MEQKEYDLRMALEEWRLAKAVEDYGEACTMDYGPGIILPTTTLDRIVDSAQHLKLRTIDDLRKETRWSSTVLYGAEVLAIVNRFIAQPPALTRVPICPASQPQPHVRSPHNHNTGLKVLAKDPH